MGRRFEIKGISEVFDELVKTNSELGKMTEELKDAAQAAKGLFVEFKTSGGGLSATTKATEKQSKANSRMVATLKAIEKANKKKLDLEAKISISLTERVEKVERLKIVETSRIQALRAKLKAEQKANVELEKSKLRMSENRKEAKKLAAEELGLTTAYDKLSNELNDVRKTFKAVAAQYGVNSKESERYKKRVQDLDGRLKEIDAAAGQHQRNVGDYGNALRDLNPAIGGVIGRMNEMGASLQVLSTQKKPFAPLISGFKALGRAALAFVLTPVGAAITIIGGLFALINGNKDIVVEFNKGLIAVGKTTNIAGEKLRALGQQFVGLSRELKVIGTDKLLDIATVAGQLGISGSKDIINFTRTLAMLETATDIVGEQGATQIAQFLNAVEGGVQNVGEFGAELTKLGNTSAATESKILDQATAIAQKTSQYDIGRQSVLAYAAATASIGLKKDLTSSVIGKVLREIDLAIVTGNENLKSYADLLGVTEQELGKAFSKDKEAVLFSFVKKLNEVSMAGGSVSGALNELGLKGDEVNAVLPILASKGFGLLETAMENVGEASGSLQNEFESASLSLENQTKRIGTAWDNLIKTVEDGQGVFSKLYAFFVGVFAGVLEDVNLAIDIMGATFKDLGFEISLLLKELGLFQGKGLEVADVMRFFTKQISSVVFIFTVFVFKIKEVIQAFNDLVIIAKSVASGIALAFVQIQDAFNSLDLTNPLKSIDTFITKLGKINIGSTISKSLNARKLKKEVSDTLTDIAKAANVPELQKRASDVLTNIAKDGMRKAKNTETPQGDGLSSGSLKPSGSASAAIGSGNEFADKTNEEIDALKASLDFFLQTNQDKLKDSKRLSEALIDLEKNRLNEIQKKEQEILDKKFNLDEKTIANKLATNQDLTKKEQEYYTETLKLKSKTEANKQQIDKEFQEQTLKEKKNALEIDKMFALVNSENKRQTELDYKKKTIELALEELEKKQELNEEEILKRKEATGLLTDTEKEYIEKKQELRDNEKEIQEEEEKEVEEKREEEMQVKEDALANTFALIGKEREAREAFRAFEAFRTAETEEQKLQSISKAAGAAASILGQQTAAGKAAAIAQASVNTYLAATSALKDLPFPLNIAAAGSTIAFGLLQVQKILSQKVPKFAKGKNIGNKDSYEGLAIKDEQGAELHTDGKGNIKDFGSNSGAKYAYVGKDDVIYPAHITKRILNGEMQPSMGFDSNIMQAINLNFERDKIDYDVLAKKIAKENAKNPTKNIINLDGQIVEVTSGANGTKKRFIPKIETKPRGGNLA